jgi:hypothetical protein
MSNFLIETTNDSGVVKQERVSVNQTVLSLGWRSLVRIVGLERATTLEHLDVPIDAFLVSNLTYSRFRSARGQLLRRRASVCARVDTARRSLGESLVLFLLFFVVVANSSSSSLRTACRLCPLPLVA